MNVTISPFLGTSASSELCGRTLNVVPLGLIRLEEQKIIKICTVAIVMICPRKASQLEPPYLPSQPEDISD